MRAAFLAFVLAVAACAEPIDRSEIPDSEFDIRSSEDLACFDSIADASAPLIEQLRAGLGGERGAYEVRVTRREEQIYVIDAQMWDSGHDDRGYYHERQILERSGARWCQARVLHRSVRVVSY
jgi:hypothetical protein